MMRRLSQTSLPHVAMLIGVVMLCLAGCGSSSASDAYGGAQNHIHDMITLRDAPQTLLIASHIGLYRTSDGGHTWAVVAGGSGQAMDGLMIYKLGQSSVDPKRVYVLAIPRNDDVSAARAPAGLYTSGDAGLTWSLASPVTALPSETVYTIGVGATSAEQVFTILPSLAENGLYVSNDMGKSWNALPTLPDAHPRGVMGDPGHPHHVFLWSETSGFFNSNDDGQTWQPAEGIKDGIYSVTVAGDRIYASGEDGVLVSTDDGAHFSVVHSDVQYTTVMGSDALPTSAFALTGSNVAFSTDGGMTWNPTAALSRHPGNLAVDPEDAKTAYIGFSYPMGIEMTTDGGQTWRQVLP